MSISITKEKPEPITVTVEQPGGQSETFYLSGAELTTEAIIEAIKKAKSNGHAKRPGRPRKLPQARTAPVTQGNASFETPVPDKPRRGRKPKAAWPTNEPQAASPANAE